MNRPKNLLPALVFAFAVETLSVTWALKIPGAAPILSVLYCASGLVIGRLLTRLPAFKLTAPVLMDAGKHEGPESALWKSPAIHFRLVVAGLLILATWSWCQYWFDEMPIDITNADMLPIIRVMGERFIAGRHGQVYDIIPWIWHGTQPIYLPAMWLPYVPAIALGIDMRWIAVAGLLFAFTVFLFLYDPPSANSTRSRNYLSIYLGALAFLLFWWVVADNTPGIVSVAEEGTVIGYYVLLVLALVSGKPWLTGIAISLCMLSRYALAGWIPAYLLILILGKKWKYVGIVTLTGILCFLLLFLLPVGWDTFLKLASLPGHYVAFAARVWKDSPDTFSAAPGFAWFFGPRHIVVLHRLLLTLSFLVPVLFVVVRRGRQSVCNLPLATLKITLVIFYSFIDVPYLYLFYTSTLVSLIAVTLALRTPVPVSS
ncbi:MAG TPA: hypothetical protein VHE54_13160 [Puia sp.]|nr:hypothetical protein [Puia sp.]